MKLGEAVQITIGTADLEESVSFYEKVGYATVAKAGDDEVQKWVQLTDGDNRILLAAAEAAYRGLTYFGTGMRDRVEALKQLGIVFVNVQPKRGAFRATFYSPNDVAVTLIEQDPDELSPLDVDEDYTFRGGTFGEYSVPVVDLAAAIAFWSKLGFETTYQSQEPYPWAIVGDGLIVLGLHQTDEFDDQALTYFSPTMGGCIVEMKKHGVEFASEMEGEGGLVDNAIVEAPDGQQFFFFQGEV